MTKDSVEDLVPEIDRDYLIEKGYNFTASRVGQDVHIILQAFNMSPAYAPLKADLMIVLPSGYPNANLDMFWTFPDVKRANGMWPQSCEHHETHNGRSWQRWSRHFSAPWRQGIDNLQTFLATVKRELEKGI